MSRLTAYYLLLTLAHLPVSAFADEKHDTGQFDRSGSQEMETLLKTYIEGKDARIGVAVIINGKDTVEMNGRRDFPMMSVFKFPQAIAVAEYCLSNNLSLSDTIAIHADEIKENTWSPMREKYGTKNLSIPLSEILEYSVSMSDNNACDILFRIIGGTKTADSLMKSLGFRHMEIINTEDEMHIDPYLCYQNRSTPIEMAGLFDAFYRMEMRHNSPVHEAIGSMMMSCETGKNRLPKPLENTNAVIGHKTGTGDKNSQGRIMAVNDAGYVFLPDGQGYAIAVFVADSSYDMAATESIISDISEIVYNSYCKIETPARK